MEKLMILYIDTETYSDTDISVGTYRYLQDVEVMLVSYAIGSGPVAIWDRTTGEPIPADLQSLLSCSARQRHLPGHVMCNTPASNPLG